ncbi:MAG: hypothetical protein JSV84_13320 [Gemmatimonadota bacterium]|nr:MAG: hypothetical protein JSV84_13320 [Gemmatimonadota bacterium]
MREDEEKGTVKRQETLSIFKIKILIHNLNRKKEKKFTELGRRVYDLIQKKVPQILGDDAIKRLLEEVRGIERGIEKAERQIGSIRTKVHEENKKPEILFDEKGKHGNGSNDTGLHLMSRNPDSL